MLALMQQPGHPIHTVLLLMLSELRRWEERPEGVRKARIQIDFRADARLLAENLLEDDRFVAEGVHATDLKVSWWETFLASLEQNWRS
jgi:hypothetical protein